MICAAVLVLGIAAGAAVLTGWQENYALQAVVFGGRYGKFDDLIRQSAARHGVDPALVKAVIWRESKFQPRMVGADGERGLMQITEGAASDWAREEKIETFVPVDLFDPRVNIEAGTWYLARALRHWADRDDPVPFALAEYNAGRQRVKRWQKLGATPAEIGAAELREVMDFPTTKRYIADIVRRYAAFRENGEFAEPKP